METWDTKVKKVLRKFGKNKTSFHLKKVLSKSLKIPNYDVCQDEETITISVHISGIENHASDMIQAVIQPMSIELKVTDLNSLDYFLKIRRLSYEIVCKKSSIKMEPGVLHFILHKTRPWLWNSLYYHNPKCIANFRSKVADLRANPVFEHKTDILLDLWGIEKLSESGRHVRDILQQHNIAVPHSVKTIDDIIGHMKMTLDVDSNNENFRIFAAVVYMKQTQESRKSEPKLPDVEEPREKKPNFRSLKAEESNIEGNEYFKAKKYLKANLAYFQAVDLKPECLSFYRNRAVVFYHTQMYKECIEDLLHVLSVQPLCAKSRCYLGKCLTPFYAPNLAIELLYQSKFLEPRLVIEDDLLKAFEMSYCLSMYVDAAKCDNDAERERHMKSLIKIVGSFFPYNLFNLMFGNDQFASSESQEVNVYLNAVKECIKSLCEGDMISLAKTEVEKLIQPFDRIRGELQSLLGPEYYYYFLSLCYYYEDNESEFMKNFKTYERKIGFTLLEESDEIDEVKELYTCRERGNIFFERQEYDTAIIFYKKELNQSIITEVIECRLYYKIASAFFCLNEVEETRRYLELALTRNCDFHEAIALRGELFWKVKSLPSSILDFQRAHELYPCERYQLLIDNSKGFKSDEEKVFLEKMDKESVQFAETKKIEGNQHFKNKDYDAAIKLYTEAIGMNTNNPIIYSNRAACHIMIKNYEKGLKDAKETLKLDPLFIKGVLRLSKCCIALGKPDEALTALEKALSLDSEEGSLRSVKIEAEFLREKMLKGDTDYNAKNYDSAKEHFSAALSKAKACIELHLKIIDCLISLDKYDEALAEGDKALLLDGDNTKVLYNMGLCYFYKVDQENTIDYLEKAIELDPSDTRVEETIKLVKQVYRLKNLERNALSEENMGEALLLMEEIIKQPSKNKKLKAMTYCNMGIINLGYNGVREAVGLFTKAINLLPDYDEAYDCRADCYFKLEEYDRALQDYEKLYKLIPTKRNEKALHEARVVALSEKMKKKMGLKTNTKKYTLNVINKTT